MRILNPPLGYLLWNWVGNEEIIKAASLKELAAPKCSRFSGPAASLALAGNNEGSSRVSTQTHLSHPKFSTASHFAIFEVPK